MERIWNLVRRIGAISAYHTHNEIVASGYERSPKSMSYTVTLLPGSRTISVDEDESILDAALRAGINLPHSCRGGSCGSCRARVTGG